MIVGEVNLIRGVGVFFCHFSHFSTSHLYGRECRHEGRHPLRTEWHSEKWHFIRSDPGSIRWHPLGAVLGIERRYTLRIACLFEESLFPFIHIVRGYVGEVAVKFTSVFLCDVDHLWPAFFLAIMWTFHRLVGNLKPECGSVSLSFRRDTDNTAEEFYDCLADRESESGALHEAVELYEAFEDFALVFNGDSGARVLTAEIEHVIPYLISESDASLFGEFDGVGKEIDHYLRESVGIRLYPALLHTEVADKLYSRVDTLHYRFSDVGEKFVEVRGSYVEFHRSGLGLRNIEDIAYDLKQHLVVCLDYTYEFLLLLRIVGIGEHIGESYDGIEGSPYLMAHVGEEGRFKPVGLLGAFARLYKPYHLLLALGDAGERSYDNQWLVVFVIFVYTGVHLDPFDAFSFPVLDLEAEFDLRILQLACLHLYAYASDTVYVFRMYKREQGVFG